MANIENALAMEASAGKPSDYDYYDRLRATLIGTVPPTEHPNSTVLEVLDPSTGQPLRLLHIACPLGFSHAGDPIYDSFDQAKTALMAQYHWNNGIPAVVPNLARRQEACRPLKLTIDFFNTEENPAVGTRVLVQDIYTRPFPFEPTVVLGAQRSAVSASLATLNRMRQLPQISHYSTSARLDDRLSYPYFGRVIPSNAGSGSAVLDYFVHQLHTTHLAVLYVDDEYGTAYLWELQQAAAQRNIVIRSVGVVWDSGISDDLRASVGHAAKQLAHTGFRHFLGIVFTAHVEALLDVGMDYGIMGPDRVWIFGDGVYSGTIQGLRFPVGSPQAQALHGTGIITIGASNANGNYQRFLRAFQEEDNNPDFRDYFAKKSPLATDQVVFPSNYSTPVPSDFSELIYDAVMAIGIAGCQSGETYFTGPQFFEEFVQSEFVGASGRVQIDPSTGGRQFKSVTYVMLNVRVEDSGNDGSPLLTQTELVLTAELSQTKNIHGELEAFWENLDNVYYEYAGSTRIPPPNLPPREIEDIIHPVVFGVLSGVACLVMFVSIGFAMWTWVNRESHIIKVSQPSFLLCICFGEFLMACAVIMAGVSSPPMSTQWANFSCMATVWLLGLGFSIVFTALYTKTLRINKIFGSATHFRRIRVTAKDVALRGCLMVFANLIIIAIWQVADPFQYELDFQTLGNVDVYGRNIEVSKTCQGRRGTSNIFLSAIGLVTISTIVAANIQAYKARHITTEYTESVYIALSTGTNLQGVALAFPASFAVSDPQSNYIARSSLVLLIASTTLFLIFVPKVWHRAEHIRLKKEHAERKKKRRERLQFEPHHVDYHHDHEHADDMDANPAARVSIRHEMAAFRNWSSGRLVKKNDACGVKGPTERWDCVEEQNENAVTPAVDPECRPEQKDESLSSPNSRTIVQEHGSQADKSQAVDPECRPEPNGETLSSANSLAMRPYYLPQADTFSETFVQEPIDESEVSEECGRFA